METRGKEMSDSGDAALSLVEALLEHLEAEGVLTPGCIGAIYDGALLRVQAKAESGTGELSEWQVRLRSLRRQ
jgi:hypothetical protein